MLYAIGNILSKAVAFLMLPIYTRYLTPADYGVAALIEMTLDVIAIVAGAQIANGIFRFYHKTDTEAERRLVVSTTFAALATSYVALGLIVFGAAEPIARLVFDSEAHAGLIRLAAVSFALQCPILVALAFARVRDRSGLVLGATLAKLAIAVSLNLLFLVGLGMGLRGMFYSTLGANLVVGLALTVWIVRAAGLGVRASVLRSLIRYGMPLMGVQAALFTMTFSDRYFLQAAGGEAVVGLYNLSYQFGFLLLMLAFVPIEMIWGPKRFHIARSADPSPELARAFRLINVSVFTIGVGIALFVSDVLRVMSTPPFHPAARIVPIILVAYVFHGWAMIHDIGVLVKERTEYLTVANWTAAIVALSGFAILVPRFYGAGAAVAAVLAFSVRWGLTYRFSQQMWPVRYDWPPVLRLAALSVAVVVGALLLPALPLAWSVTAHTGFMLLYVFLLWNARVLSPDEKRAAADVARRLTDFTAIQWRRLTTQRHTAS